MVRRRTQRRKSGLTSLLFGESWPRSAGSRPAAPKLLELGWEGGEDRGVCHPHSLGDPELPWSWEGDQAGAVAVIAFGPSGEDDLEALKAKNIKQTELVADLREAILRVARHFQCTDPKNCHVVSRTLPVLCPMGPLGGLSFPSPL